MSGQLAFFSEPRARRSDLPTSHQAAKAVSAIASETEYDIAAAVYMLGPSTDDEICESLPAYFPPTVKTARSRMTKKGVLVATGGTRPSGRNRAQTVWALSAGWINEGLGR